MNKYIAAILACVCSIVLQAAEPLQVGTNAEFPPYTYIEDGQIIGFDIDVAKEVARRLEREMTLKDMPFDALIPDIILGRVDFVAAGMSATEERAKRVLFTKPYLKGDPLVIFTVGAKGIDFDGLQGKTVIVVEGFTADTLMSPRTDVTLIRLPTQADAFMAIKAGRAEAFVTAETTVKSFLQTQSIKEHTATPISGTGETCCLVVPKGKPELHMLIQKALDEMEQDGTLDQIRVKWKLQ